MKKTLITAAMIIGITMSSLVSAATLFVEKRVPVGSSITWSFALTVSCANLSVFNFSLTPGQTGSFIYPDATPLDCSISETMSGNQADLYIATLGDTYGADDGTIQVADAALVDGQTFYVLNAPKWGGKASSIVKSSIPVSTVSSTGNESTTWATPPSSGTTTTLPQTGPSFVLATEDPYTCGAWFVGQIMSPDLNQTTVTIDLKQAGKSVKLFTPFLNAQGVYSQAINYTDSNSVNYVVGGTYEVIVTATHKWLSDTLNFTTNITNQCDIMSNTPNPDYRTLLKNRNADIIDGTTDPSSPTDAVSKPLPPKKLPNTGAEIIIW